MVKYGWNLKRNRRGYRFCDVITLMINIKKTKISHYDLWLVMILISGPWSATDRTRSMWTVWIDGWVDVWTNLSERFDQSKLKRNRVTLEMSRISSRTFSGFYRLTLRSHNKKKKTGLKKLTFNLFWPGKFDFKGHSTMHRASYTYIHV